MNEKDTSDLIAAIHDRALMIYETTASIEGMAFSPDVRKFIDMGVDAGIAATMMTLRLVGLLLPEQTPPGH